MTNLSTTMKRNYRQALARKKIRFAGLNDEELVKAYQAHCASEFNKEDKTEQKPAPAPKKKAAPKPKKQEEAQPEAPTTPQLQGLDIDQMIAALTQMKQNDNLGAVEQLQKEVEQEIVRAEAAFANIRTIFNNFKG